MSRIDELDYGLAIHEQDRQSELRLAMIEQDRQTGVRVSND
jgi:hypothetical protein